MTDIDWFLTYNEYKTEAPARDGYALIVYLSTSEWFGYDTSEHWSSTVRPRVYFFEVKKKWEEARRALYTINPKRVDVWAFEARNEYEDPH